MRRWSSAWSRCGRDRERARTATDERGAFRLDAMNMREVGNVLVFRNRGRMCPPMVIVDGNVFNQRRVQWNVNTLVLGEEVRAVEVYSEPQTVPGSLTPSGDNICGAVAIWTASGLGID